MEPVTDREGEGTRTQPQRWMKLEGPHGPSPYPPTGPRYWLLNVIAGRGSRAARDIQDWDSRDKTPRPSYPGKQRRPEGALRTVQVTQEPLLPTPETVEHQNK